MPLVRFKDLCIDANDVPAMQGFWASSLHLDSEFFADDGSAVLRGDRREQTIWINLVREAQEVKNRVHLDLWAPSLEPFVGLEQVSGDDLPWTTFADPEGNQFCVFVDADRAPGLKDVEVDAADHVAIAAWWADVWGGTLQHDLDHDYSYIDDIPGAPVEAFDFAPVPEPKTVKNRLHWDVTLLDGVTVDDLVAAGAAVLAAPNSTDRWTVMADPEGNEFCVFAPE